MAFYKIQVKRQNNTPRIFNVTANKTQDAIRVAALSLRDEGITDARSIEVMGQVNSLRD